MRRTVTGAQAVAEPSGAPAPTPASTPEPVPQRETLRTEFEFTLPRGFVDADGVVHRDGVMRVATARDELLVSMDARVNENPAYATVFLLSRVTSRLGSVPVTETVIENMFASDVAFMQDLYRRINAEGHTQAAVSCPACEHTFTVDLAGGRLGES